MHRKFILTTILLVMLLGSTPVWAGPLLMPRPQAARSVITSPEPFQALRGQVPIRGSATHPQFQRYELYYKMEPSEDWVFIGDAHFAPVDGGVLGTWDTNSLPDGTYSLRLRVVRLDGNYEEALARQVLVANAQPTETSTPEISPTPTQTPTPLPPTPTVIVEQPSIPTATPRPSPSATSTTSSASTGGPLSGGDEDGGLFGLNRYLEQVDAPGLGDAFILGIEYTLLAFVAVGAYFVLKRLVVWLWIRIRG